MNVRTDHDGEVAIVTVDDGRGNALTAELCDELAAHLDDAGRSAQAIVLAGTARAFSAGGDLDLLRRWSDWEPHEREAVVLAGPHAVTRALLAAPVPTVAAIDGPAAGAGLDLALVCDLRVASPRASFAEAYIHVGVVPGDGGAWLLPRHVGLGTAMDMLLTGRRVDAEEARRIGIVGRLSDDPLTAARETARLLATRPRRALLATRAAVYDAATESLDLHLRTTAVAMGALTGGTEHRDAVAAVLARRDRA